LNGCDAEFGTIPFVTVTGVPTVVAVPAQVPSEKNSYVTVPPALLVAPVRVAESVTEPPAVIVIADRVVAMVGLSFETAREKAGLGGEAE